MRGRVDGHRRSIGRRARRSKVLAAALLLGGCAAGRPPTPPGTLRALAATDAFTMADGTRLPYRSWAPAGKPWAVVLALHGMNDSRDAFEVSAPTLADAGVLVVAPDQRGFGATATRGRWPGVPALVSDARAMAADLAAAHPRVPVFGLGESMGGAVLTALAASDDPRPLAGVVLAAPAVRDRRDLGPLLSASLWIAYETVPGLALERPAGVKILATDNPDALRRLSTDPLTIGATRVDATKGLVDLMDAAQAGAPRVRRPVLLLVGGRDDLVPGGPSARFARDLPPALTTTRDYPRGHHLLLRDLDRAPRLALVVDWLRRAQGGQPAKGALSRIAKDP